MGGLGLGLGLSWPSKDVAKIAPACFDVFTLHCNCLYGRDYQCPKTQNKRKQ